MASQPAEPSNVRNSPEELSKMEFRLRHGDVLFSRHAFRQFIQQFAPTRTGRCRTSLFQSNDCWYCVVSAAVAEGSLHLLDSNQLHERKLNSVFWTRVLEFLVSEKRHSCVLKVLEFSKKPPLIWLKRLRKEDERPVYDVLRKGTQTICKDVLSEWFKEAISHGQIRVLTLLVLSENEIVHTAVTDAVKSYKNVFLDLLANICLSRNFLEVDALPSDEVKEIKEKLTNYTDCLRLVCKSGLFSLDHKAASEEESYVFEYFSSPLELVVENVHADLVRRVYTFGASIPNSEVFRLAGDRDLKSRCESQRTTPRPHVFDLLCYPEAAVEIRNFLESKASQPSALEKLSLRFIQQRIGWGYKRDRGVKGLEIANPLKAGLTFASEWTEDEDV